MARIAGRHGRVSIADASPETVIGSVSAYTLSKSRNFIDVTAFEDTNKQYVPDLPDVSGTLTAFYNMDNAGSPRSGDSLPLFEAAEGDTPVTLKLYPSSLDLTQYDTGLAYIDVSLNVAVNGDPADTLHGLRRDRGLLNDLGAVQRVRHPIQLAFDIPGAHFDSFQRHFCAGAGVLKGPEISLERRG